MTNTAIHLLANCRLYTCLDNKRIDFFKTNQVSALGSSTDVISIINGIVTTTDVNGKYLISGKDYTKDNTEYAIKLNSWFISGTKTLFCIYTSNRKSYPFHPVYFTALYTSDLDLGLKTVFNILQITEKKEKLFSAKALLNL